MLSTRNILKGAGLFATMVIVGIGLGWLGSRHKSEMTRPVISEPPTPPSAETVSSTPPASQMQEAKPGETQEINAPATEEKIPWDQQIGDILGSDDEITDKSKKLLELYPTLPNEGKVEAAQHLANLVSDEDYAPLGKILVDPKTPAAASESLLTDLFNRANSLKLPLFLTVARTPNHPQAAEAKNHLELLLEEDYGNDWPRWEKKMKEWLKENPD